MFSEAVFLLINSNEAGRSVKREGKWSYSETRIYRGLKPPTFLPLPLSPFNVVLAGELRFLSLFLFFSFSPPSPALPSLSIVSIQRRTIRSFETPRKKHFRANNKKLVSRLTEVSLSILRRIVRTTNKSLCQRRSNDEQSPDNEQLVWPSPKNDRYATNDHYQFTANHWPRTFFNPSIARNRKSGCTNAQW